MVAGSEAFPSVTRNVRPTEASLVFPDCQRARHDRTHVNSTSPAATPVRAYEGRSSGSPSDRNGPALTLRMKLTKRSARRIGLDTDLACEATGSEHGAGAFHRQRRLKAAAFVSRLLAVSSVHVLPRGRRADCFYSSTSRAVNSCELGDLAARA